MYLLRGHEYVASDGMGGGGVQPNLILYLRGRGPFINYVITLAYLVGHQNDNQW